MTTRLLFSRLSSVKAFALLTLALAAILFAIPPAQAQGGWSAGWVPCDANGTPFSYNVLDQYGFQYLAGTGTTNTTMTWSMYPIEYGYPMGNPTSQASSPTGGSVSSSARNDTWCFDDGYVNINYNRTGQTTYSGKCYWKWQAVYTDPVTGSHAPPSGSSPPAAPSPVSVLLSVSASANVNVNYSSNGPFTGLNAQASITVPQFPGDSSTFTSQDPTAPAISSSLSTVTPTHLHLFPGTVSGNMLTVSLSGSGQTSASDAVLFCTLQGYYGTWPDYQGPWHQTAASASASLNGKARLDSRTVSIGANVDPTNTKTLVLNAEGDPAQLDANGYPVYVQLAHQRAADGSMAGDIGIDIVTVDGKDGTAAGSAPFYPNIIYTASRSPGWSIGNNPSHTPDQSKWTSAKSGSLSDTIIPSSPNISPFSGYYFGDYYYIPNYDLHPDQKNPGNFGVDNVNLSYTDGADGATAMATYSMTTHEAYEPYYDIPTPFTDIAHPHNYFTDRTSESGPSTSQSNPFLIGLSSHFQEVLDVDVGINLQELPIPWIKLIPIDFGFHLHDPIDYSSVGGYMVTQPYQYSYLVVYTRYVNHKGADFHYDMGGYENEKG